jgi:hypothetical protein
MGIYSSIFYDNPSGKMGSYAKKIIASAETVYYAGSPSNTKFLCDLPEGVQSITVAQPFDANGYGNGILINYTTDNGITTSFYESNVPIKITANGCDGSVPQTLCPQQGTRNIIAEATENGVDIHY